METSDPVHSEDYREHQEIQAEILKPKGNELLYKDAPITVDETLLAVLTLALTEKLNGKTIERIFKINCIAFASAKFISVFYFYLF